MLAGRRGPRCEPTRGGLRRGAWARGAEQPSPARPSAGRDEPAGGGGRGGSQLGPCRASGTAAAERGLSPGAVGARRGGQQEEAAAARPEPSAPCRAGPPRPCRPRGPTPCATCHTRWRAPAARRPWAATAHPARTCSWPAASATRWGALSWGMVDPELLWAPSRAHPGAPSRGAGVPSPPEPLGKASALCGLYGVPAAGEAGRGDELAGL